MRRGHEMRAYAGDPSFVELWSRVVKKVGVEALVLGRYLVVESYGEATVRIEGER